MPKGASNFSINQSQAHTLTPSCYTPIQTLRVAKTFNYWHTRVPTPKRSPSGLGRFGQGYHTPASQPKALLITCLFFFSKHRYQFLNTKKTPPSLYTSTTFTLHNSKHQPWPSTAHQCDPFLSTSSPGPHTLRLCWLYCSYYSSPFSTQVMSMECVSSSLGIQDQSVKRFKDPCGPLPITKTKQLNTKAGLPRIFKI